MKYRENELMVVENEFLGKVFAYTRILVLKKKNEQVIGIRFCSLVTAVGGAKEGWLPGLFQETAASI